MKFCGCKILLGKLRKIDTLTMHLEKFAHLFSIFVFKKLTSWFEYTYAYSDLEWLKRVHRATIGKKGVCKLLRVVQINIFLSMWKGVETWNLCLWNFIILSGICSFNYGETERKVLAPTADSNRHVNIHLHESTAAFTSHPLIYWLLRGGVFTYLLFQFPYP